MKTNLWPNVLQHTQDHIFTRNSIGFYYRQVFFNMCSANMITCWKYWQSVWDSKLFMAIAEDIVMMFIICWNSLKKNIYNFWKKWLYFKYYTKIKKNWKILLRGCHTRMQCLRFTNIEHSNKCTCMGKLFSLSI